MIKELEPAEFKEKPAHFYSFEIVHTIFTDEIFDLYVRYEKSVHKKEESEKVNF